MAWTATGGNLKGPKGDPGTNGAKGDAGTSLHVANITVSSNSDVATSVLSPSAPMTVGEFDLRQQWKPVHGHFHH